MMLVYKTRPEVRDRLCTINHVDNTGRLQTVSKTQNPRYHALIEAFARGHRTEHCYRLWALVVLDRALGRLAEIGAA